MKRFQQKTPRPGVSIRWKLIVYFAIFVAIALFVTWIFQVYLLNNFYELVKRREMANSAKALSLHIEKEDLNIHAYDQALDGVMTVAVYRFNGKNAMQIVNVDATGQAGIAFQAHELSNYYDVASQNGGSFTGKFKLGGIAADKPEFPFLMDSKGEQSNASGIRLGHIQLVEGKTRAFI